MGLQNEVTGREIAESFKDLVVKHPFEKITIQMIADGAGLSRQTFYNYYEDKNEVFSVILDIELLDGIYSFAQKGLNKESIKRIFLYFEENKEFYFYAFKTEGQNSFREILTEKLIELFEYELDNAKLIMDENLKILSNRQIAKFHVLGLVELLSTWIATRNRNKYTSEDLFKVYIFLTTHSIVDIYG